MYLLFNAKNLPELWYFLSKYTKYMYVSYRLRFLCFLIYASTICTYNAITDICEVLDWRLYVTLTCSVEPGIPRVNMQHFSSYPSTTNSWMCRVIYGDSFRCLPNIAICILELCTSVGSPGFRGWFFFPYITYSLISKLIVLWIYGIFFWKFIESSIQPNWISSFHFEIAKRYNMIEITGMMIINCIKTYSVLYLEIFMLTLEKIIIEF